MKTTRLVLWATVLSMSVPVLMAQTQSDLTFEQLQAIAAASAQQDPETGSRLVPEMLQFFREEEIKYTGGEKYKDATLKFRLHTPEPIEEGKTYPLILWLHGVGEAGDDNKEQLSHLHHVITYLTGPKKRDFFLLVPQTPRDHTNWDAYNSFRYEPIVERVETIVPAAANGGGLGGAVQRLFGGGGKTQVRVEMRTTGHNMIPIVQPFEESPLGFSFAMVEEVCKKYPVDRNRITVSGLSSGGDGTWRALERAPDLFAAAVPLVSWNALKDDAIEQNPILKKIPIWAIYSSDDSGIDQAREDFARVEAAGCNVKKSEFGLCQHNAWTPAMLQADIFSWLLSRAKKDGEYIAVEDASVDPSEMQGIVEVAVRDSRLPTLAPPQSAAGKPGVARVTVVASPTPAMPPMPEAMSGAMGGPQFGPPMHGGMSGGMPMGGMGMPMHGGMPGMPPRPPVDKETLGLCVKAMLADFEHGSLEMVAPLFMMLPPEAQREFLGQALKIVNAINFASFDDERRETLGADVEMASEAAYYRRMIDKREERARMQVTMLGALAASFLASPHGQSFPRPYPPQPPVPPNAIPGQPFPQPPHALNVGGAQMQVGIVTPRIIIQEEEEEDPWSENTVDESPTGKRKVEDCDKEWEMSTATLYGLYPADWTKETATLPDFVRKLSAEDLAEHLRKSFAGDGKDAKAVCEYVLRLDNRPLSSPLFVTSGGRLKDDVRYALSPTGEAIAYALKKELERKPVNTTKLTIEKTLRKLGEIVKP
ncbi:MAG: hypothetical protein ACRC46_05240 [Thermoguttaceae bacterium]